MTKEPLSMPPGWRLVQLGDVTSPSSASLDPIHFEDSAYISLEHIEGGTNHLVGSGDASAVRSTKHVFHSGDVLYGKLRPYLNKVCRPTFDGVCSTDILVFPQIEGLDNGYLLYFLTQQSTVDFATQHSSGINLPRISAKKLLEIEFPLPPLPEQRRIVSRIVSLRSRSANARKALSEIDPLLVQFRQSVLQAAFCGRLTKDWRATNPNVMSATELLNRVRIERRRRWTESEFSNYMAKGKPLPRDWQNKYKEPKPLTESEQLNLPAIPSNWVWAPAEEIVEPGIAIVYGIVQPGPNLNEGVPYVRGLDVQNGHIKINQLWKTSPTIAARYSRSALQGGDVLLGIIRHTKVAIVPDALSGGNMGRATARFRPSSIVASRFLAGSLESPQSQRWLSHKSRGSDMPIVNVSDVRRIPVPLAPLEEQAVIVAVISRWNESADLLQSAYREAEAALQQLDRSILAKAFRGELVAQDPRDEPASMLLPRINALRVANRQQVKKEAVLKPDRKGNGDKLMKTLMDVLASEAGWVSAQDAFALAGVTDGSGTDAVERLYEEMRSIIGQIDIERRGSEDWLRLKAIAGGD